MEELSSTSKLAMLPPKQLQILTDESGSGLDSGSLWQKCENQVLSDLPFRGTALRANFPAKPSDGLSKDIYLAAGFELDQS